MAKYQIPITWESYKTYQVEAENLQEAVTKALSIFLKEPDDNYLNDSFSIDDIVLENYPGENFNESEAMQNVID